MRRLVLAAIASGVALLLATAAAGAPVASAPPTSACAPVPSCPGLALEPGPRRPFANGKSHAIVALGPPHHRASDLFQREGVPQVLRAKLTYGSVHKDLEHEAVDVWLLAGCTGSWQKLGTAITDDEGRVSFSPSTPLPAGLHRVRFVVAGDGSSVDAVVDVLAASARFFVSDVDGTLTSSESAEVASTLRGLVSRAHPDAARAFTLLAERGYRPLYLSARPEWLSERTREFLGYHGFPMGAVRVTEGDRGATGDDAARFKSAELARLASEGLVPSFGFGNKPSDTQAYEAARITPANHRVFYRLTDAHGGRRIEAYGELLPELARLPCP